jgi:hypothetical protein
MLLNASGGKKELFPLEKGDKGGFLFERTISN